jgi:Zn-dependent protease with chaperone function
LSAPLATLAPGLSAPLANLGLAMSARLATLAPGPSAELGTLALGIVAGLAFAAATSLAVAVGWPLARRRFAGSHPAVRARVAWVAAVAPGALPPLLVGLCFAPGLLGAVGLHADHCTRHPEHAHLCLLHPNGPLTPALGALLALATATLAAALAREAALLARARRWLARLPRSASALAPDLEVVESETAFSFAAGLLRPRVHVSSALVRALPRPRLDAVLEHERAHARRRDPLARLAARVLSWAHLPPLRRELLAELELASEQACDAEAGRRVGDRVAVAEAILAVERILAGSAPAAHPDLPAFGEAAVAERVRELLAAERPRPGRGVGWPAAAVFVGLALALADPIHHATEHLLRALASAL